MLTKDEKDEKLVRLIMTFFVYTQNLFLIDLVYLATGPWICLPLNLLKVFNIVLLILFTVRYIKGAVSVINETAYG
jgi:uncharacterized membrane protein